MVRKAYEWAPMSTRSLGRAKNRWENDVKNGVKSENKQLEGLHQELTQME
jgi:hypothetical protein